MAAPALAPLPIKRVFISHGWSLLAHEAVLDGFVDSLADRLRYLPLTPARAYRVEVWFDRRNMHGRSGSFDDQSVPACSASDAIVLILNDKFYASAACQAEVACFRDPAGAFRHDRAVKIQLSGRRKDGDPEMTSGPVQPELFSPQFPTLLALWTKGDDHLRDEFVTAIRDDILAILDQ
jgi:hypothetical protein